MKRRKRITAFCTAALLALCLTACASSSEAEQAGQAEAEQTETAESTAAADSGRFDAEEEYQCLQHCAEQIREITDFEAKTVLVLGSGLGYFTDQMEIEAEIPYKDLEGFPASTVEGHEGKLVFGTLDGVPLAVMKGRVHYYEGYSMQEVVRPLRVLHLLGADTVILTNAAGAINADFAPGDLVLVRDHISSFIPSPLLGENLSELGPRFADMTRVYDPEIMELAQKISAEKNIPLQTGVLIQVPGPQYETPTEIDMYRQLGADHVCMSTVVEAIAARHMDMRVCTISCITNMGAGMEAVELSHDEIEAVAKETSGRFTELITELIRQMPEYRPVSDDNA